MHKAKRVLKHLIHAVLVIFAIILIWKFGLPAITSDSFQAYVKSWGLLGPLVIIVSIVIAQVVAPIPGSPVWLVSFALFGMWSTLLYVSIAGLVSSSVNFYISKRFGRKLVAKLVGAKNMEKIDEFTGVSGTQTLIIARLFGFALFDIISYAAGLTNLSFKKYFVITALGSGVSGVVFAYAFQNLDFTDRASYAVIFGTLVVIGIIFTAWLTYKIKK